MIILVLEIVEDGEVEFVVGSRVVGGGRGVWVMLLGLGLSGESVGGVCLRMGDLLLRVEHAFPACVRSRVSLEVFETLGHALSLC